MLAQIERKSFQEPLSLEGCLVDALVNFFSKLL